MGKFLILLMEEGRIGEVERMIVHVRLLVRILKERSIVRQWVVVKLIEAVAVRIEAIVEADGYVHVEPVHLIIMNRLNLEAISTTSLRTSILLSCQFCQPTLSSCAYPHYVLRSPRKLSGKAINQIIIHFSKRAANQKTSFRSQWSFIYDCHHFNVHIFVCVVNVL